MFDNGYARAAQEYERYLSEPPMSEDELLEEYNKKEDYLETEGDRLFEEYR